MTREEAIAILDVDLASYQEDWLDALDMAIKALKQEPKKSGKWIDKEVRGDIRPYCSVCGEGLDVIYHYRFCPNCGADMRGENRCR